MRLESFHTRACDAGRKNLTLDQRTYISMVVNGCVGAGQVRMWVCPATVHRGTSTHPQWNDVINDTLPKLETNEDGGISVPPCLFTQFNLIYG